ncbi:MAG: hypothetical protein AVDCRST_MAG77-1366 [uncultured Chloroflexi bacterium]|uniref:Uncharacterized protein n=1 Tax=uncultured Chloroflexota bacterium TaxID=166587 RepID=A0A6J4I0E3_9CHLR|nr:MAG: hypothetical protein AVDCRST_MAG77-1366 [uncultured Chloroflexota bacterium]
MRLEADDAHRPRRVVLEVHTARQAQDAAHVLDVVGRPARSNNGAGIRGVHPLEPLPPLGRVNVPRFGQQEVRVEAAAAIYNGTHPGVEAFDGGQRRSLGVRLAGPELGVYIRPQGADAGYAVRLAVPPNAGRLAIVNMEVSYAVQHTEQEVRYGGVELFDHAALADAARVDRLACTQRGEYGGHEGRRLSGRRGHNHAPTCASICRCTQSTHHRTPRLRS